ncbi:hypothetical protein HMPREF9347_03116 [Escherichia coli MS 124-1]|uniref:Uncharacterized protein n=1 Tax=Escherichia coli MS 85-1 TaxID=679202 RepID=A0AAN3M9X3_ECOLX|nr:hypothetical protein HMPREF9536_00491 [Escherichia coli MS 84-1]EFK67996.1 hypothetical protein HMPREF9347_03116 [Escherichia coli MS 124-1]EFU35404.1 hypothetical protein HMPREF9350_02838 [Escherichia coli MS 85-1]
MSVRVIYVDLQLEKDIYKVYFHIKKYPRQGQGPWLIILQIKVLIKYQE